MVKQAAHLQPSPSPTSWSGTQRQAIKSEVRESSDSQKRLVPLSDVEKTSGQPLQQGSPVPRKTKPDSIEEMHGGRIGEECRSMLKSEIPVLHAGHRDILLSGTIQTAARCVGVPAPEPAFLCMANQSGVPCADTAVGITGHILPSPAAVETGGESHVEVVGQSAVPSASAITAVPIASAITAVPSASAIKMDQNNVLAATARLTDTSQTQSMPVGESVPCPAAMETAIHSMSSSSAAAFSGLPADCAQGFDTSETKGAETSVRTVVQSGQIAVHAMEVDALAKATVHSATTLCAPHTGEEVEMSSPVITDIGIKTSHFARPSGAFMAMQSMTGSKSAKAFSERKAEPACREKTTPVPSGNRPAPVFGETKSPPVSSGNRPLPVFSENRPPPVSSSNRPLPVFGEAKPPSVSSSNRPLPVFSETKPPPVSSGNRPLPAFGETKPPPVSSSNRPLPVFSEKKPPSVSSDNRPLPVFGENRPPPLSSVYRPLPAFGEKKPPPVSSSNRPLPVFSENKPPPLSSVYRPLPVFGEKKPPPVSSGNELPTALIENSASAFSKYKKESSFSGSKPDPVFKGNKSGKASSELSDQSVDSSAYSPGIPCKVTKTVESVHRRCDKPDWISVWNPGSVPGSVAHAHARPKLFQPTEPQLALGSFTLSSSATSTSVAQHTEGLDRSDLQSQVPQRSMAQGRTMPATAPRSRRSLTSGTKVDLDGNPAPQQSLSVAHTVPATARRCRRSLGLNPTGDAPCRKQLFAASGGSEGDSDILAVPLGPSGLLALAHTVRYPRAPLPLFLF